MVTKIIGLIIGIAVCPGFIFQRDHCASRFWKV